MTSLVLVRRPPPQDLSHAFQEDHSESSQSTGTKIAGLLGEGSVGDGSVGFGGTTPDGVGGVGGVGEGVLPPLEPPFDASFEGIHHCWFCCSLHVAPLAAQLIS